MTDSAERISGSNWEMVVRQAGQNTGRCPFLPSRVSTVEIAMQERARMTSPASAMQAVVGLPGDVASGLA